jgi:hypothetical protein
VADETTAGPASAGLCPTCGSDNPKLHPATAPDGGEVQMCPAVFHYPPTPELDRQSQAIKDGAHKVGEFLDWLASQGLHLCEWREGIGGGRWYERSNFQQLIADFYSIDLAKIEAERQALLEHLRALNA